MSWRAISYITTSHDNIRSLCLKSTWWLNPIRAWHFFNTKMLLIINIIRRSHDPAKAVFIVTLNLNSHWWSQQQREKQIAAQLNYRLMTWCLRCVGDGDGAVSHWSIDVVRFENRTNAKSLELFLNYLPSVRSSRLSKCGYDHDPVWLKYSNNYKIYKYVQSYVASSVSRESRCGVLCSENH